MSDNQSQQSKRKLPPVVQQMKQEQNRKSFAQAEVDKDRGIALTLFIVFQIIVAVFTIFFLFDSIAEINSRAQQYDVLDFSNDYFAAYRNIGLMILVIIAAIGLWNWQRWGYIILIVLFIIMTILAFLDDSRMQVAIYATSILFLEIFLSDNDRKRQLE